MMTLYHNQQRIMVEGIVEGQFRIIRGHHRSNGSLVGQIVSFKHWMMQLEFLTLRVVRRNKIRLQILINPDPAQKDFLDFHFSFSFIQKFSTSFKNFNHYKIFTISRIYEIITWTREKNDALEVQFLCTNSFLWFFKINK